MGMQVHYNTLSAVYDALSALSAAYDALSALSDGYYDAV